MKSLILCLAAISLLVGSNSQIIITDYELSPEYLGEALVHTLKNLLLQHVNLQSIVAASKQETRLLIPIFPPAGVTLPEIKLPLPDLPIEFDTLLLQGNYTSQEAEIYGIETLKVGLNLTFLIPILAELQLGAERFGLLGKYDLDLIVNMTRVEELIGLPPGIFDPELQVEGNGPFDIGITGLTFNIGLAISIQDNKFVIKSTLILGIESLKVIFENLMIGGIEFDWNSINWDDVRNFLLAQINPLLRTLEVVVDALLDSILANCVPSDILSGDLSCLGLPPPATTTTLKYPIPGTDGAHYLSSGILLILACFLGVLANNL